MVCEPSFFTFGQEYANESLSVLKVDTSGVLTPEETQQEQAKRGVYLESLASGCYGEPSWQNPASQGVSY